MKLVSYYEATKILDISMDTLKQAVSKREVLTRAARKGQNVFLIEEQVRLFTGINPRTGHKKRLSFAALTQAEKQAWKQYADEASQGQPISATAIDEESIRRIVAEDYARRFRDMLDGAKELYERGVPQGAFFERHPILAMITYGLTLAISLAPAITLFNELDHQQKLDVVAYLGMLDATLQAQERMTEPPISIEEIRARRQRIVQFKQMAKVA